MKSQHISVLFIFLSLFIIVSCKENLDENIPAYDFVNPAYLNLEYDNVSDSIYVNSWHWNNIPGEEVKIDSFLILGNGIERVSLNVVKPQLVKIYFNKKRFDFFLIPGDTTNVEIDFVSNIDSLSPKFSGELASINQYFLAKSKRFNTWDFFIQRAGFTQSSFTASDLAKNNDDLTELELDFLKDFFSKNSKLPQWFQEYEKQNILITSGYFKINSIFYRDFMLGMDDTIPGGYYNFIDSIDVNSEIALLTDYYFYYLSDLISSQFRSNQSIGFDTLTKLDQNRDFYNYLFDFISRLDRPGRELYSLHKYFYFAKHKPEYTEVLDSLKHFIMNPEYKYLLDSLSPSIYQIPKNIEAPGFYLQDYQGNFRKLKEFRGKVVLLNFWSTNCIPCLKEFPFEDTLANKLKNEEFQLINICMNSTEDDWKRKISGHTSVLQLYAKNNWNDVLKENYKIYSNPKFVLIDKNGITVNANALRPSDSKLIEEIRTLLEKNI